MSYASLQRPRKICVFGLPGVGKSEFTRCLHEQGAYQFREQHVKTIGCGFALTKQYHVYDTAGELFEPYQMMSHSLPMHLSEAHAIVIAVDISKRQWLESANWEPLIAHHAPVFCLFTKSDLKPADEKYEQDVIRLCQQKFGNRYKNHFSCSAKNDPDSVHCAFQSIYESAVEHQSSPEAVKEHRAVQDAMEEEMFGRQPTPPPPVSTFSLHMMWQAATDNTELHTVGAAVGGSLAYWGSGWIPTYLLLTIGTGALLGAVATLAICTYLLWQQSLVDASERRVEGHSHFVVASV